MRKKRGNGEGCIYHRPNGSWRAMVSLQGRRISKTFESKGEAQLWIRKTLEQIDNGMTILSVKRTLTEHLNNWLENEKPVMRPPTWIHYEQLIRMYVIPALGTLTLKNLRTEHVQRFYTQLINQGIGAHTVRKIHAVLHHAMNLAVETGVIQRNPVSFAHQPKKPVHEMEILNEDQTSQFLLSINGHRWEALFRLEAVTGLRQMEILGLQWKDLDWHSQKVKVERQLVRPDKTGVKFLEPKTRAGRRTIDLDDITIHLLRQHYERQQTERLMAGEKWQDHELIFTSANGTPIEQSYLRKVFYRLLDSAGLPRIHFHGMRHTAASLMLNHGIPAIVVSKRLGHARVSITEDVYGHLIPGMQAEAAKLISDLITPIQLHPVAPEAPTDVKLQQNLNDDPWIPPKNNQKPAK